MIEPAGGSPAPACYNGGMKLLMSVLLGAVLCTATPAADAQQAPAAMGVFRTIPAAAQRGEMQPPWQGQTRIDGTELRFAPGVQIRDQNNRIILSDSIRRPLLVKYLIDPDGQIIRVWVLTAEEAAAP